MPKKEIDGTEYWFDPDTNGLYAVVGGGFGAFAGYFQPTVAIQKLEQMGMNLRDLKLPATHPHAVANQAHIAKYELLRQEVELAASPTLMACIRQAFKEASQRICCVTSLEQQNGAICSTISGALHTWKKQIEANKERQAEEAAKEAARAAEQASLVAAKFERLKKLKAAKIEAEAHR
jgi:hypothetical protein